jgi:hypothetical protein
MSVEKYTKELERLYKGLVEQDQIREITLRKLESKNKELEISYNNWLKYKNNIGSVNEIKASAQFKKAINDMDILNKIVENIKNNLLKRKIELDIESEKLKSIYPRHVNKRARY